MGRILTIAYTSYAYDGRVKRETQALRCRGDDIDLICVAYGPTADNAGIEVTRLQLLRFSDSRDAEQMQRVIEDLYFRSALGRSLTRCAALAIGKLSRPARRERYYQAVDSRINPHKELACADT